MSQTICKSKIIFLISTHCNLKFKRKRSVRFSLQHSLYSTKSKLGIYKIYICKRLSHKFYQ